jgi:phage anti-repressor protein
MSKESVFITLLKKHTNIDIDFINTFFKQYKIGSDLDFHIQDTDVAKFLGISLNTIRRRLNNTFSKNINFLEKADYIKVKTNKTSSITYMINYQCFERLAMNGDSERSEVVRMYFIKLREFLTENQHLIYQAMENKKELNKYSGYESIYFFAVDDRKKDIFKVGRTADIVQRLRNYNVGRVREVELKYFALVSNSLLIEKCIKLALDGNKLYKNKEIFKVEPQKLKQIIDECYCKYVSKKQHVTLYEEISNLLGLYAYTKDKVNIKPYIIIGKNL